MAPGAGCRSWRRDDEVAGMTRGVGSRRPGATANPLVSPLRCVTRFSVLQRGDTGSRVIPSCLSANVSRKDPRASGKFSDRTT